MDISTSAETRHFLNICARGEYSIRNGPGRLVAIVINHAWVGEISIVADDRPLGTIKHTVAPTQAYRVEYGVDFTDGLSVCVSEDDNITVIYQ